MFISHCDVYCFRIPWKQLFKGFILNFELLFIHLKFFVYTRERWGGEGELLSSGSLPICPQQLEIGIGQIQEVGAQCRSSYMVGMNQLLRLSGSPHRWAGSQHWECEPGTQAFRYNTPGTATSILTARPYTCCSYLFYEENVKPTKAERIEKWILNVSSAKFNYSFSKDSIDDSRSAPKPQILNFV